MSRIIIIIRIASNEQKENYKGLGIQLRLENIPQNIVVYFGKQTWQSQKRDCIWLIYKKSIDNC